MKIAEVNFKIKTKPNWLKEEFNQVAKPSAFKKEWSPLENGMIMNKWVLAAQFQINKNDLMSFVGPFVFWSNGISILGQTPTHLLNFFTIYRLFLRRIYCYEGVWKYNNNYFLKYFLFKNILK